MYASGRKTRGERLGRTPSFSHCRSMGARCASQSIRPRRWLKCCATSSASPARRSVATAARARRAPSGSMAKCVASCMTLRPRCARQADHDDRGTRRRRAAPSGAAGVRRARRPAVRLLHARHGDELRALVERNPDCTLDDVRGAVSGHLCRCGAYPNIFKATLAAAAAVRRRKHGGRRDERGRLTRWPHRW